MSEDRLDKIERLLERTARDSAERDRQLTEKLDQVTQQQAGFQDGLNETKALQQQNAQAISQLTANIGQLRQAIADGATNTSDLKTELARHADDSDAHSE